MTNEAIEAAARAMCEASPFDDDKPSDYYAEIRAASPALMEEGARLALEAAAQLCNERGVYEQEAYGLNRAAQNYYRARDCIRRLDPAAIVKGAGHE